jgi:DNA-binding protein Fis
MAAAAAAGGASREVTAEGVDFELYIADIEKQLINSALKHAGGVQTKAADLLNVSYRSFRHLLKKYNI